MTANDGTQRSSQTCTENGAPQDSQPTNRPVHLIEAFQCVFDPTHLSNRAIR